jgi:hypothetical protein
MISGLRRNWKQVLAYYFTFACMPSLSLKTILTNGIAQLQKIGLKPMATICAQGSTPKKALKELCSETNGSDPYVFYVNGEPIVTIFDVPHLLKCMRNTMLRCSIQFATNKVAKCKISIPKASLNYYIISKIPL